MCPESPLSPPTQPTLAAVVKIQIERAISDSENRILSGIQKSVSDAVEARYKVVVARLEGGGGHRDSHLWQILLAVLPIMLTIGLGWWVTRAQTAIVQKIDDQKQELTTRLALTQEYQKRKLDVYEKCSMNMSILADSLQPLRLNPKDLKSASDSVRDLYDCTQNNPLYVTKEVADLLENVQRDGIAVMQNAAKGTFDTSELEKDTLAAETQMLRELTSVTIPLSPSR